MADALARALAAFGGGMFDEQDAQRKKQLQDAALQRQQQQDAQAKAYQDFEMGRQRAQGSLDRARTVAQYGLTPPGTLDPADFAGTSNPGFGGIGLAAQAAQALDNAKQAPTVGLTDEQGATTQYRVPPETPADRKVRLQQEAMFTRQSQLDAQRRAEAQAAQEADAQRRLGIIGKAAPNMPPEQAAAIAHDDKTYQAWVTQQFSPKPSAEGTWELSKLTRNGVPQLMNSRTMAFRDAPAGLQAPDKSDNPQQIMLGQRGVQGATMMYHGHKAMSAFEQGAKQDPSAFTGADQFLAEFNREIESGKVTTWHAAQKAAALTALNKTNPALAQYIRAGMQFAFGENEIQQRPSDFRTKMSEVMNSISAAMDPQTIDMVTGIRSESMLPTLEASQKLRQRMKMAPDPEIDAYIAQRRGQAGAAESQSPVTLPKTIPQSAWAQLSPGDQKHFQQQGYRVVP